MVDTNEIRLIRELSLIPTATFYEDLVQRKVIEELSAPNLEVEKDEFGNVISVYKGDKSISKSVNMAFVVHSDHPAFHLTELANGKLLANTMGGLNKDISIGSTLDLHCAEGGIFSAKGKIIEEVDIGAGNPTGRFIVEVEGDPRGVKFGTLALDPMSIDNKVIRAGVLDDFAGIAMVIEAQKQIARAEIPVNIYTVFHRAEEVGFIGAYGVASKTPFPKSTFVFSIETSSIIAKRKRTDKESQIIAKLGEGIILREGDGTTPGYDSETISLMRVAGLEMGKSRVQKQRMYGGSCEASLYYAMGYRAAGLCLPLSAWHNNGDLEGTHKNIREGVHIDDLANGVLHLVTMARMLGADKDLYKSLGDHDITPEHVKLVESRKKAFAGYLQQGFMKGL